MAGGKNTVGLINLVISLILLGAVVFYITGGSQSGSSANEATARKLAGELADNNLPKAAIQEYQEILTDKNLDDKTKGNLYYLIGKMYYEGLSDYENGAAYFIRARTIYPEGSYFTESGKSLIACLEKMGRIMDAKRELDKAVNIDSVAAAHEGEKIVAKIGDMPVYESRIDKEIQKLPADMQKDYTSRKKKLEALNQYIQMELIYKDAVRKGLENDPEVQQAANDVIRQAVISKYIKQNIIPPDQIDTVDVFNYYLAHKNDKYGGKDYADVKADVLRDYGREKFQEALSEYVNNLAAIEKVQIFEENVQ